MDKKNISSIGRKVKIFYDKMKYEGILLYEDDIIYIIEDKIDGKMNIPKSNSVLKEVD